MKTYEIWYMKPDFMRDGLMGYDWLRNRNKLPTRSGLEKTHTKVKTLQAEDLDMVFHYMQAEMWSPKGEARELIKALGLEHTSMAVGDVAVDVATGLAHFTDSFGWRMVLPEGKSIDQHVAELEASVREGRNAMIAFRDYCEKYRKHGLSPRLEEWIAESRKIVQGGAP